MKAPALASVLVVALALIAASVSPSVSLAQGGVCEANPSPPDAGDPSMIVDSPTDGATVTSPLTVTGQARTFEANVVLTLFDENGTEISTTNGLAAEGGVLSPFSIDISFSVTADTPACLWVYESSAQDGSPINVVQVELTLAAAAGPLSPAAPATGTGGADGDSIPPAVLLAGVAALAIALAAAGSLLRRRA